MEFVLRGHGRGSSRAVGLERGDRRRRGTKNLSIHLISSTPMDKVSCTAKWIELRERKKNGEYT